MTDIKPSADLVAQARAEIAAIGVEALRASHARGEVAVIDVRDADERRTQPFIAGSHHAPRGMLEFLIDPVSSFRLPVFAEPRHFVFVCGSGGRAALAAKTAKDMGLPSVGFLDGGMKAWLAAGAPVERAG